MTGAADCLESAGGQPAPIAWLDCISALDVGLNDRLV